jgi:tRNA (cmo5U34)-methyltransferase
MTSNANSFEVNRWHTTEYVDEWITTREREEGRALLRRKLVSLLPFGPEDPLRILDIGAGGGALSWEILSFHPGAQIVCQDFSAVMLAHASQKLAKYSGQVTFVQSDLTSSRWMEGISGNFQVVVSSLVMHTVPQRVWEIYGEVYGLVQPGGCFLIVDNFAPPGPDSDKVYLKARLKAVKEKSGIENGLVKNPDAIENGLKDRRRVRNPLRGTLTLVNNLEWLKQAGFDEVDCLWKEMNHAVIGGFRHRE